MRLAMGVMLKGKSSAKRKQASIAMNMCPSYNGALFIGYIRAVHSENSTKLQGVGRFVRKTKW